MKDDDVMELENMSGPELVLRYNQLAMERDLPTVKRFASLADGRRRCAALLAGSAAPRNTAAVTQPVVVITSSSGREAILADFKTSTEKLRGKLIAALYDHKGTQVTTAHLVRAIYGTHAATNEHVAAFRMVLRGMKNTIKTEHKPYRIEQSKSETGVISYGLYDVQT